jgi:hypothetical protein
LFHSINIYWQLSGGLHIEIEGPLWKDSGTKTASPVFHNTAVLKASETALAGSVLARFSAAAEAS